MSDVPSYEEYQEFVASLRENSYVDPEGVTTISLKTTLPHRGRDHWIGVEKSTKSLPQIDGDPESQTYGEAIDMETVAETNTRLRWATIDELVAVCAAFKRAYDTQMNPIDPS